MAERIDTDTGKSDLVFTGRADANDAALAATLEPFADRLTRRFAVDAPECTGIIEGNVIVFDRDKNGFAGFAGDNDRIIACHQHRHCQTAASIRLAQLIGQRRTEHGDGLGQNREHPRASTDRENDRLVRMQGVELGVHIFLEQLAGDANAAKIGHQIGTLVDPDLACIEVNIEDAHEFFVDHFSPASTISRHLCGQNRAHEPQWRQMIGLLVSSSQKTACMMHAFSQRWQPMHSSGFKSTPPPSRLTRAPLGQASMHAGSSQAMQTIATNRPVMPPRVRTLIALFVLE